MDTYQVQQAEEDIKAVDAMDRQLDEYGHHDDPIINGNLHRIKKQEMRAMRLEAHARYYTARLAYHRAVTCLEVAAEERKLANTMRMFAGCKRMPVPRH